MAKPKYERPEFAVAASRPGPWFDTAESLLLAADAVESRLDEFWARFYAADTLEKLRLSTSPNVHTPYFMLMAFAVENLLKGLIVRGDPPAAKREAFRGRLRHFFGTHDLVALAKKARLDLGGDDEQLLHRLSKAGIWMGRYPIPMKGDDLLARQGFPDGQVKDIRLGHQDVQATKRVVLRIQSLV